MRSGPFTNAERWYGGAIIGVYVGFAMLAGLAYLHPVEQSLKQCVRYPAVSLPFYNPPR